MRIVFASVAMLALAACQSTYVGKPYVAPEAGLSNVAIADDSLPADVIAYQAGSTMSNFGLLGAMIDAGVQSSRKGAINEALESIEYEPEAAFEAYVIEALGRQGVEAAVIEGPDREKREFLVDYPEAGEDVQAYLDIVVVSYGYMQAGGNAWRPAAAADVRLVDRATGKTIMENRIYNNIVGATAGVITISPNPEYTFQNREDMTTNPERLADGIDDALRAIVDGAVGLLR